MKTKASKSFTPLPGMSAESLMESLCDDMSEINKKQMYAAFEIGFRHAMHCIPVYIHNVRPVVDFLYLDD